MKFKKFNEEILDKMHLSYLRELGREMGVKAPTGENKESLIESILKIQRGNTSPIIPTKRGAPPKIKIDLSEYYDTGEETVIDENQPYPTTTAEPLILKLCDHKPIKEVEGSIEGVLEVHVSGFGFLRVNNYENSKDDIYVSTQNIRKFNLRRGDKVRAIAKVVREGDSAALQEVISINDLEPELFLQRADFDDLTPYYPTRRIKMELPNNEEDLARRCIDLFAPIGMGQRGLIVAPPKAGKTTLIKKIAQSIEINYPEIKLFVLLVDERPEEVTDMQRSIAGEVVSSTFDEGYEHHIRASELVINRAKRLVEVGTNVVILMDSITKLARAYNATCVSTGRTLSGGIDPMALTGPKKFFGAARNIENGGTLTIISTALVDTGSRMDDVIYEEFKGTGNMEIHLSRELSEKRIFPALDLYKSGTRRDELLMTDKELDAVKKLRKLLSERSDASESLLEMLKKTTNNQDFIERLDGWLKLYNK